jgi:hypothetical protein
MNELRRVPKRRDRWKMEWKRELDLNTKDLRDCVHAADN